MAFPFPLFIVAALVGLLRVNAAQFNKDGELRFHENTIIVSHNSAANKVAADGDFIKLMFGVDQENSIYDQLSTSMVRGLSLDIKIDLSDWSKLRLVHSVLDFGDFETEIAAHLVPFLEENAEAITLIYFEVVDGPSVHPGQDWQAIRSSILKNLQRIFSNLFVDGVSLADMTFKYNSEIWAGHDDWPSLNEIRSSGQRLFIIHDRSEFRSTEYGFMYRNDVMKENVWEGIEDCTERYEWNSSKVSFPYSSLSWSRLFFMNHFDTIVDTVGEGLLGGGINGWGILFLRTKKCMESNGFTKPTFVALDWVVQVAEALEVVQYLKFGGKIGSGQRCTDNSHCATGSCNTVLGFCQCKECSMADSVAFGQDSCFGCESEQHCVSVENGLNECLNNTNPTTSTPNSTDTEMLSYTPTQMPVVQTTSSSVPSTSIITSTEMISNTPTLKEPTTIVSAKNSNSASTLFKTLSRKKIVLGFVALLLF